MKTKKILLLLALGLSLPLRAQYEYSQALNGVLTYTCSDGSILYDWVLQPLATDLERASLKGDISKMVVTHKDYRETNFIVMGHVADTLCFDANGMLVTHRYPKSDSDAPNQRFIPCTWRYTVEGKRRLMAMFEENTQNVNFPDLVYDRETFSYDYDAQGRLVSVMNKVMHRENGEMVETHQGFTQHPWAAFSYDAAGKLVSGSRSFGSNTLKYQQGCLVEMGSADGNSQPVRFKRDASGRIISINSFSIDGLDEEEYYERECTLTYNEFGDIARVYIAMWNTNESWKRQSVAYKMTYTVTYKYDPRGNWTSAVVKVTEDGRTKTAYESTRTITYREDSALLLQMPTQQAEPRQASATAQGGGQEKVYDVVEKMPVFPGGNVQAYIAQHLKYPDGAEEICVQGRVIVSFVIEKDGSISNAKVEKSLDPLFDKEAMRMVSGMPRWQPGRQNGKPVRVRYTLPVTFRLV